MTTPNILDDYALEDDFCAEHGITKRTCARYRNQPDGLPFMMWGGKVWIHLSGAREFLVRRTRKPNPRVRSRVNEHLRARSDR
jgi:hypothetical protein